MCACVHVRACTIVEAVCSITDDGMWLASLWGYVWNKCDTEVLNVVPVNGRFFVVVVAVVNEDLKSTVLHVAVGFVLICTWVSNVENESVRSAHMRHLQEYVACRPFLILCKILPAHCRRFPCSGVNFCVPCCRYSTRR